MLFGVLAAAGKIDSSPLDPGLRQIDTASLDAYVRRCGTEQAQMSRALHRLCVRAERWHSPTALGGN